ncbi:SRSF2 [Symbiodinium natans]|uniref:SRSF2 protein n=1 Tax=Symbiodinium natans TaxID=878477 RepID=A0A812KXK8_9DINO|nr:SRSF2 [Symbiodinium natans]
MPVDSPGAVALKSPSSPQLQHKAPGAEQVVHVHAHLGPVRALSSGGDILLTASEDGTIKQLDVLSNFSPSDFFTVGVPALSIRARGKNVLVGCEDGVAAVSVRAGWSIACAYLGAAFLQKFIRGAPARSLDADPEGPGGRVLAVGGGRFGVWLDPAQRRQAGPDDEAQQPAISGTCGPSETAVLLLPGQPKDLLQITCDVSGELDCNCHWTPAPATKFLPQNHAAVVWRMIGVRTARSGRGMSIRLVCSAPMPCLAAAWKSDGQVVKSAFESGQVSQNPLWPNRERQKRESHNMKTRARKQALRKQQMPYTSATFEHDK